MIEVTGELRRNEMKRRDVQELFRLLRDAKDDPGHLLAVPNTLLVSQPALKRLKDGLIDAQLRTSTLQGRLTDAHPQVRAAVNAVDGIKHQMRNEIDVALRGVETDLRMADSRAELLQKQRQDLQSRLDRLVALRVDYSNLVADVDHHTQLLAQARTKLMNARADQVGANTGSLLSRIDSPNTGTKPAGPSHAMIVLAGLVGGLIIGLGLLVLTVPPLESGSPRGVASRPAVASSDAAGHSGQHVPSLVDQAL